MSQPLISVIIPTYNRGEMLCRCVRSVLATEYPALEVIVVDDCSPDDTRERIAAEFGGCSRGRSQYSESGAPEEFGDSKVRYLCNDKNSFQAVSRNRGAAAAKGEYLFFLDDDNIVHPDIFTELLSAFGKGSESESCPANAKRPEAGLIAPMAVHKCRGDVDIVWSLGSDFNRWTSQPKDVHPNLPLDELSKALCEFVASADSPAKFDDSLPEHLAGAVDLLPTSYYPNAFMVPRKVFDEVGGFEESYVQIFEESDFGWKIKEAGYENFVAVKAVTDHYGFLEPGCVPELRRLGIEKPLRTFCFARNRLRFARRHFSLLQALSVTLVFAPLSAGYYCFIALRNRRPDIAWAYFRGTVAGIFGR